MTKSEYHHGNLKEELLQIALDFIAKEDIDKLTLKVLSDATGTSRSAIYKHFKSKDALIEKIIEQGFNMFDNAVSPALNDKSKPLVDRFYLSGKLYVEFAKQHSNLYRLLFGKKYSHIREEMITIKDEDCRGFGALKKAIEEGQASGILKKENSYQQSIVVWSTLHGFSSLIIDGFMDVEEIYEDIYESIFESLLAGLIANKVKILSSLPFVRRILKPQ